MNERAFSNVIVDHFISKYSDEPEDESLSINKGIEYGVRVDHVDIGAMDPTHIDDRTYSDDNDDEYRDIGKILKL